MRPGIRDLDKELESLRRLPANKTCPNCPATAPLGFRDVCVKFPSFVCSDCKAAHQAFSHRIKSLGMSTFDVAEVDALASGGNAAIAATWLGKLDRDAIAAAAPRKDAKLSDWHAWIRRIYLDREFYVELGVSQGQGGVAQSQTVTPVLPGLQPGGPTGAAPPPLPPRKSVGGPVAPPVTSLDDLFDFSAPPTRPSMTAPPVVAQQSVLDDPFFDFLSQPSRAVQSQTSIPSAAMPITLNMDAIFGALPAQRSEMQPMGSSRPGMLAPPLATGTRPTAPRLAPPPSAPTARATDPFARLL
jgi:Putative GTPase activating protein for Arf